MADAGSVRFDGIDVVAASAATLRALRRRLQIVFQDPASALDPRQRIADALGESIRVHGIARGKDVTRAVAAPARRGRPAAIGGAPLSARVLGRPAPAHRHRPRARARAGSRLRRRAGVRARRQRAGADPGAARRAAASARARLRLHLARPRRRAPLLPARRRDVPRPDRRGRSGAGRSSRSRCIPTRGCSSRRSPIPDPEQAVALDLQEGEPPSPVDPPSGCHFHPRCPFVMEQCKVTAPVLRQVAPGRRVACHLFSPSRTMPQETAPEP